MDISAHLDFHKNDDTYTLAKYILQLEEEIKKSGPTPQLLKLANFIEKFKEESNDISAFDKKTVRDLLGEINRNLILDSAVQI